MKLRRLFSFFVVPFLLIVGACTSLPERSAAIREDALLIANVTVVDAANGSRENIDVLVIGDQIREVTSAEPRSDEREDVRLIDGTGKFLIPGLWDAHVHLAYRPGLDHRSFFPLSLAHGVTSLRDTGGHLAQLADARALAKSEAITPNLFVSGPLIDGEQRVYAGQSPSFPDLSVGAATAEEAIERVNELAAQDVDFIKAYEMLSPDAFRAVVTRAREVGLPVAAHSPLSMTAVDAASAGIADMQHLRNLEMDCADNAAQLLDERRAMLAANDASSPGQLRGMIHSAQRNKAVTHTSSEACDALIAQLAMARIAQTPTLTITRFPTRKLFAEERWRDTYSMVPAPVAEQWMEASIRLAANQPTADQLAFEAWLMMMVKKLHDGGVPIIAGTDAPIGFLTPGASLHEELAMLVEAGLEPLDAIRAATVTPAEFFGLQDRMGLVQPGMRADLVLLDANPLADIRNTLAIRAVIKDGHYLDRAKLDEMLVPPKITD